MDYFLLIIIIFFSSVSKKKYGVNEDVMTNGATTTTNTLKMKYSPNGLLNVGSEPIDEMKCIPEVSESDIEVIFERKQFGHSRYGEVLLGRFRDSPSKIGAQANSRAAARHYGYFGNEVSSEAEIGGKGEANGNGEDKTVNGTEETLVILKTLEKEKLRSEFLHEMKSKWFISAKSERVAKLIGYLSTPRRMAMVLECGNCDLAHFLPNCDKKAIG